MIWIRPCTCNHDLCLYMDYVWLCLLILVILGLYAISGRTSYHKISWSLEAVRLGFSLFHSPWKLLATQQQLCRYACQISQQYDHYDSQSRGFEPFMYGDEMMHKAWCDLGQVPFCFSRLAGKSQVHVATKSSTSPILGVFGPLV